MQRITSPILWTIFADVRGAWHIHLRDTTGHRAYFCLTELDAALRCGCEGCMTELYLTLLASDLPPTFDLLARAHHAAMQCAEGGKR